MQVMFLLALLMCGPARPCPQPHVISQRSVMVFPDQTSSAHWERRIYIRNPLDRPVWFWIECESQLTSTAIGLAGHHTSEYVFPDIPPTEQCEINHWIPQRAGVSPPEWTP